MSDPTTGPIPPSRKLLWRQFASQILPVLTFIALGILAAALWSRFYTAQNLAGVGEGLRSTVASPQAGWLRELKVRPFQLVNAGDPVAVVEPVDPRMPIDLVQAEIQVEQLRREPSLSSRNAMDYERMRTDWLRLKAELDTGRVNLERAQNDARRSSRLFEQQLLSEELYDLAVKTRDALVAEVAAKSNAVILLEERLQSLRQLGDPESAGVDDKLLSLLNRLDETQAKAASNWGPITLVAPISGMVSGIIRNPGEYVLDGEPLVNLSALWSDRIVGYMRQPYPVEPRVGMKVRVTTRASRPQNFWTTISGVGAQVEPITNALAFVRQGALVDAGLPVVMEVPPQMSLRPGEIVDFRIEPQKN